jgi:peptide/nickel transport system substrate-binding protein
MHEDWPPSPSRITRRKLAQRSVKLGVGVAAANLLAACGSSSGGGSPTPTNSAFTTQGLSALPGGTPKPGGTFTAGVITGGTAEELWPGFAAVNADLIRQFQLYNLLFYVGPEINPIIPGLALSAESNADGTVWTLHLRHGVRWHDGKPFTADDIVYNVKSQWSIPAHYFHGNVIGLLDFNGAKALDAHTVRIKLLKPVAQFPQLLTWQNALIVQNGATQKSCNTHAIGTGPFMFESFTPGQQSVFVRNPDYWEEGKPYVDKLVVTSTFTDPTTLFNAMLGGEVNLVPAILPAQARAQVSSKQIQILQAPPLGQTYAFAMRVDQGPLADNRVRTAFKLLVDRQTMIDGAVSGFGTPQPDLIGAGCQYFASDLKRTQDVEQAKSLFKAAGVLGHTFTLQIADALPGMVESATILAQQAPAAGVQVNVQQLSPATYFVAANGFTKRYFGYDVDQPTASLTTLFRVAFSIGCQANDTHWCNTPNGQQRNDAINAAIGEVNTSRASEMWHELQAEQFNEGGYIVWANVPFLDAAANNVRGLKAGAGFNYNGWRLQDGWID